MSIRFSALALILMVWPTFATAGVRRIWAVNDGEKVERDATNHPASARNSSWDGRVAHIFGAKNEIVAFQVIVEADAKGVKALSLKLDSLASASDRIAYRAPGADPTDYVGRPIEIFAERYMNVTTPSHASWVFDRDSPAAQPLRRFPFEDESKIAFSSLVAMQADQRRAPVVTPPGLLAECTRTRILREASHGSRPNCLDGLDCDVVQRLFIRFTSINTVNSPHRTGVPP